MSSFEAIRQCPARYDSQSPRHREGVRDLEPRARARRVVRTSSSHLVFPLHGFPCRHVRQARPIVADDRSPRVSRLMTNHRDTPDAISHFTTRFHFFRLVASSQTTFVGACVVREIEYRSTVHLENGTSALTSPLCWSPSRVRMIIEVDKRDGRNA